MPRQPNRPLTARPVAALLAAVGLVSACLSACSGTSEPQAPAGSSSPPTADTVWQRALAAVDANGAYSKDAALTLFAVAFGDMPGVDTPTGHIGKIRSATIALRAVLAHRDELTPAQRARVDEVRSVPNGAAGAPIVVAAVSRIRPVPSVSPEQRNLIEAKARQLRQDIKARLGADIPGPLTIVFDPSDVLDRATGRQLAGMADAKFSGGKYTGCYLHLYPATFAAGSNAVTTTAHEMIHCFQAAFYPDEATYHAAAQWALEGSAEWASASLVGPDQLESQLWPRYLGQPGEPLFKRTYDAIGFYAQLDQAGHSPWAAFREMWGATGNAAQYAAIGGTSADFLDQWASGLTRKTTFGAAWDATGPGITDDSAPQTPLRVGDAAPAPVAAKPYTEKVYALAANTDLIDVAITGHARLADGSVDETALGAATFCLRPDHCTCPDGTAPDNAEQLAGTGAILALTGGPDGASGTVAGRNLDCAVKGSGATWHFDSPSHYSGGSSHTIVDAYTCAGVRGPWLAKLHVTHDPATAGDPPLDRIVKFGWTFDREGNAAPTVGPYEDTVFGSSHQVTYFPRIHLDEAAGTITIVGLQGSEDGSPRIDVAAELDRLGEAVPISLGKPPSC